MSLESMTTLMNGASLKKTHKITNQNILAYYRYLTGKELFEDLKAGFESFSKNSEKLINVGSTQRNAQRNTGANFLPKVNCVYSSMHSVCSQ